MEIVKVKKVHVDAYIPTKAYVNDAGFDLHALEDTEVLPGDTVKVRTGLAIELPSGYELQVRPRSGLSINTKLRVIFGTVDEAYRGEVCVILDNIAKPIRNKHIIKKGDRIAQAVIQKIPHISLIEVKELGKGIRGSNGFGSTGINHEY